MLYELFGTVAKKGNGFCVLRAGPFGFKLMMNERTLNRLTEGAEVTLACNLYVRDTALELYGFASDVSRELFEMLISVSGIGPKMALHVMETDEPERIAAAIVEGRTDFLTRTPGIGKKTAERVIMELRDKLHLHDTTGTARAMDVDADVEEVLVRLGYPRRDAQRATQSLGPEPTKLEERVKAALKFLQSQP